jgi:hypothetical protein
MTTHAPGGGGSLTVEANKLYVDGSYTGSQSNGSQGAPYTTITAALAVAAANDVIVIAPGAYTEDLTLVDGVDLKSLVAESVVVTGTATATDISCLIQGINFIDDTAGNAFHFTGTAADRCRFIDCEFDATATGDPAFSADNTAGTVEFENCRFGVAGANVAECCQIESGTASFTDCALNHSTNTQESLVAEGDAATAIVARNCSFTGTVASEAAVANPTLELRECDITAGAVSGVVVAAGNTVVLLDSSIACTDAANDAIDGAGTVTLKDLALLDTADEIAATVTVTHYAGSQIQHGTVAAAGASPQVDAVTLPQSLPSTAYDIQLTFEATGGGADDVICSVDEGTIAVGGFSVVTTSAAAAAISGNVHWLIIHD